jgi:hypothetical protein
MASCFTSSSISLSKGVKKKPGDAGLFGLKVFSDPLESFCTFPFLPCFGMAAHSRQIAMSLVACLPFFA